MQSTYDVLIIPGSVRGKERYFRGIAAGYALKNNITKNLILSGGKTKEVIESNSLLKTILKEFPSINKSRIQLEDKSRDTVTNLENSKNIIEKYKWRKIGIMTNNYHLKRCLSLAKHNYISSEGITVEEILSNFDKSKLIELTKYLESDEMKSIELLEKILNKLISIDPHGRIPKFSSVIYYKFIS
jgi:uncharacterized SAM-binding protein YcdF (DUF218 family)